LPDPVTIYNYIGYLENGVLTKPGHKDIGLGLGNKVKNRVTIKIRVRVRARARVVC